MLDPAARRAVTLVYVHRLSQEHAARLLNVPRASVTRALARAYRVVADAVREAGPPDDVPNRGSRPAPDGDG